jgi:hypothetical protein
LPYHPLQQRNNSQLGSAGGVTLRVAVHQPHYFPWLGLVHKIAVADEIVLLDDVQFTRRNFQHRTLYPTDAGAKWLILPVRDADDSGQRLSIRELSYGEPKATVFRKHFETVAHRYSSARGWPLLRERLRDLFERHASADTSPMDLMVDSMELTLDVFGIERPLRLASTFAAPGRRDEHNLHLVRAVGGDVYVSGQGAKAYMRDEIFHAAGVDVDYQEFTHPTYRQRHRGEFVPGCWALDFFLCAPDDAREFARRAMATCAGDSRVPVTNNG